MKLPIKFTIMYDDTGRYGLVGARTSGSHDPPVDNIDALKEGVINFCHDERVAETWLTGQEFHGDTPCEASAYADSAVPWGQILDNGGTYDYPAFTTWVNALVAEGNTPTRPALQGAVDACLARLQDEPEHICAVIFVTDGEPTSCDPLDADTIGAIAAEACQNEIYVFTIGFPNISQDGADLLDHVAAEGCTEAAFIIDSGNMSDQFTEQLLEIQKQMMGCSFRLQPISADIVDQDAAQVVFRPSDGGPDERYDRVNDASACTGNQFYFDDNANPQNVTLCEALCDRVRDDPEGELRVASRGVKSHRSSTDRVCANPISSDY